MKPYEIDLNVNMIREGALLKDKINTYYYLVLDVDTTLLHRHLKLKCLRVYTGKYLDFYFYKKIDKVTLFREDLTNLVEVKL